MARGMVVVHWDSLEASATDLTAWRHGRKCRNRVKKISDRLPVPAGRPARAKMASAGGLLNRKNRGSNAEFFRTFRRSSGRGCGPMPAFAGHRAPAPSPSAAPPNLNPDAPDICFIAPLPLTCAG
jgi:hypothetical protein